MGPDQSPSFTPHERVRIAARELDGAAEIIRRNRGDLGPLASVIVLDAIEMARAELRIIEPEEWS